METLVTLLLLLATLQITAADCSFSSSCTAPGSASFAECCSGKCRNNGRCRKCGNKKKRRCCPSESGGLDYCSVGMEAKGYKCTASVNNKGAARNKCLKCGGVGEQCCLSGCSGGLECDDQGMCNHPNKRRIWVNSDLTSDETDPHTDPDDIVTVGLLTLFLNEFQLAGIVVGANTAARNEPVCQAAAWANSVLSPKYATAAASLNQNLEFGNAWPSSLDFIQATTCATLFTDYSSTYDPTAADTSMKKLVDALREGPLWLLNWGPMTEIAVVFQYLTSDIRPEDADDLIANMRIISHWTQTVSERHVYNCNRDRGACDYLHEKAGSGEVTLYELGPAGQEGLVECQNGGTLANNPYAQSSNPVGYMFDAKFQGGNPDFSDGSTFVALLITDFTMNGWPSDGSEPSFGVETMCQYRPTLYQDIKDRFEATI